MTCFGHVREQPRIVLLLQGEPPEILALDLADQHHHRGRVVIGRVQRHHRVRQPRPARHHRHPGAVAQPAVGHRHVAGAALVAADDDADRVALDQRAGQPDIALARHAIDLVDIMRFEAFRQQAGDGSGHRSKALSVRMRLPEGWCPESDLNQRPTAYEAGKVALRAISRHRKTAAEHLEFADVETI